MLQVDAVGVGTEQAQVGDPLGAELVQAADGGVADVLLDGLAGRVAVDAEPRPGARGHAGAGGWR